MKKSALILAIFTLFFYEELKADCASGGLYYWPKSELISENPVFMVEGYGQTQEIVSGLGTTYRVYLKSGAEIIGLKVDQIFVGQFLLTQAILKPEKRLSSGLKYQIVIEQIDDAEKSKPAFESTSWTATSVEDLAIPIWNNRPRFKTGSFEMMGCGPSIHADFSFSCSESYECLALVRLRNKTTGTSTDYYVQASKGIISVGHGMCSGAFLLENGDQFEVQFLLMDSSGNVSEWSEKIAFDRPK